MEYKMVKMFNSSEVFIACQKRCGHDIEGIINEQYCPPCEGAICISLPYKDDFFDAADYSEEELILFETLNQDGGIAWGDYCYLEYDY